MKKKIIISSIIITVIIIGAIFFILITKKETNKVQEDLKDIYDEKEKFENQKEESENQNQELENQKNEGSNENLDKEFDELKNQGNDIEQDIKEKEEINQNKTETKPTEDKNQNDEQKINTITVSETHITVEENLSFGPIKIDFSRGIENVLDYRLKFEQSSGDGAVSIGWPGKFDGNIYIYIYIYGNKAGTTIITVTDLDDPGPSAKIYVTVTPVTRVNNLTLDTQEINGFIGHVYYINATITPTNAQNQFIHWSSSEPEVATVTWCGGDPSRGQVTALREGTTTITAKTDDGEYQASVTITVSPVKVQGIEIITDKKLNYYAGETLQLEYRITPYDATNKNVIWSSSAPSVATVDANGLVTFHDKIGGHHALITVETEDGNFSDKINLYCAPSNNN